MNSVFLMQNPGGTPFSIAHAETGDAIRRCFPVMRQLRPHLQDEEEFTAQVRRQQRDGYRLAFLETENTVRAVAGYRFMETLSWGRYCHLYDLVTDETARSSGCGGRLFDWLTQEARAAGCGQLHLDSGVQRFGAHRFYLNRRMEISCHHFALMLE